MASLATVRRADQALAGLRELMAFTIHASQEPTLSSARQGLSQPGLRTERF